jgi:hypothetical protein
LVEALSLGGAWAATIPVRRDVFGGVVETRPGDESGRRRLLAILERAWQELNIALRQMDPRMYSFVNIA